MKRRPWKSFRKGLCILQTVCLLVMMVSPALADEPDSTNPYYQSFSGGEEDDSHSAENTPLGNLMLLADFTDPEEYGELGALVLRFEDKKGGGSVKMRTGVLSVEHQEGSGAVVLMDDKSKLNLSTGSINSQGTGVYTKMNESSTLDLTVEGDITAEGTAVFINNKDESDVKMEVDGGISAGSGISVNSHKESNVGFKSGSIEVDSTAIQAQLYDGSKAEFKVNGGIHAKSGWGILAQTDGGSTEKDGGSSVKVDVSGSVKTEGGTGLDLNLGGFENDEPVCKADITIDGTLTSTEEAVYVHNNVNGQVIINVGTDKTIENAGRITSTKGDAIFLNTIAGSSIKLTAGDVYGAGNSNNIRANAEGGNSSVTVKAGNVIGSGPAVGVSATAGHADSTVKIDADDIVAGGYGVIVDTDSRYDYGNVEDGSCYSSGGTMTVNVKTIKGGYGGISATADGGTLIVNSKTVQAGDNGYGVSVTTEGTDAEQGATVTVDGTVTAGETGIFVGSSDEVCRYLCYENGKDIQINPDDPHENWWEKMRIDETGYFVLVPVDTADGIEWEKYLWYPKDHPQYADYSEEDIANYQEFDEAFGWVDFYQVEITTKSANYAKVSTGAVKAGLYGVQANNNGGDFTIKVDGDVTVAGPESYVDDWTGYTHFNEAQGISAINTAGTTSILINGGLSVSSTIVETNGDETTEEDETPDEDDEEEDARYYGDGVIIGNGAGKIDITINGDVHAEEGTAVSIEKQYPWEGLDKNNGEAVLNIDGDVLAEHGIDAGISGDGDGCVAINISGNLATSVTGISLGSNEFEEWTGDMEDEDDAAVGFDPVFDNRSGGGIDPAPADRGPAVDILVQEVISGLTPILVANKETVNRFNITTWAIVPNENNQITSDFDDNSVESLEETIRYIIKTEDNKLGTLVVTGTGLETKKTPSGDTLLVAKQDTFLRVDVQPAEGKELSNVVIRNGVDTRIELEKDEEGYFIEVPWAGGVYLSFTADSDDDEEEATYWFVDPQTSWTKGSGEPAVFTVKRSIDDENCINYFDSLAFGGDVLVRDQDYTAVKGSTVLTISAETLEKYEPGDYTVAPTFEKNKTIETTLTIKAAEETKPEEPEETKPEEPEETKPEEPEETKPEVPEETKPDEPEETKPEEPEETKPEEPEETKPEEPEETKPDEPEETKPEEPEETKPDEPEETKPDEPEEPEPAPEEPDNPQQNQPTEQTDGPNTSDTIVLPVLVALMILSGAAAVGFLEWRQRVRR